MDEKVEGAKKTPSGITSQVRETISANSLSFVVEVILCTATKNACGTVLFQDNGFSIYEYFQRIFLSDAQRPSHLNGKHNAPKLIDLSDYSGAFHRFVHITSLGDVSVLVSLGWRSTAVPTVTYILKVAGRFCAITQNPKIRFQSQHRIFV